MEFALGRWQKIEISISGLKQKELMWNIRHASVYDIEIITEFNCRLAQETESKRLDEQVVRRGVERGLKQGAEVQYFLATSPAQPKLAGTSNSSSLAKPVGQLMLTREWSDWRDGWIAWLQSVYVVPECRGQGVFKTLLDHALDHCSQDPDVRGMRLYVEKQNTKAQRAYEKTGFIDPHYVLRELIFPSTV